VHKEHSVHQQAEAASSPTIHAWGQVDLGLDKAQAGLTLGMVPLRVRVAFLVVAGDAQREELDSGQQ